MSLTSTSSDRTSRRRIFTSVAAGVAVLGVAAVAFAVVNTGSNENETPSSVAATPVSPTTVAPTTETANFTGSQDNVSYTFSMPTGWVNNRWGAIKGDPIFGFSTAEVGGLYADPCQWVLVPPFGPTVDDLVSAWADVPGFDPTATRDITVDGYAGKQIEFTVPDYNETDCKEQKYGIWQEPASRDASPNLWAQGPNAHNQVWILDVNGTRLVIIASSFPDTSPQDRTAIDEMLASIQII